MEGGGAPAGGRKHSGGIPGRPLPSVAPDGCLPSRSALGLVAPSALYSPSEKPSYLVQAAAEEPSPPVCTTVPRPRPQCSSTIPARQTPPEAPGIPPSHETGTPHRAHRRSRRRCRARFLGSTSTSIEKRRSSGGAARGSNGVLKLVPRHRALCSSCPEAVLRKATGMDWRSRVAWSPESMSHRRSR